MDQLLNADNQLERAVDKWAKQNAHVTITVHIATLDLKTLQPPHGEDAIVAKFVIPLHKKAKVVQRLPLTAHMTKYMRLRPGCSFEVDFELHVTSTSPHFLRSTVSTVSTTIPKWEDTVFCGRLPSLSDSDISVKLFFASKDCEYFVADQESYIPRNGELYAVRLNYDPSLNPDMLSQLHREACCDYRNYLLQTSMSLGMRWNNIMAQTDATHNPEMPRVNNKKHRGSTLKRLANQMNADVPDERNVKARRAVVEKVMRRLLNEEDTDASSDCIPVPSPFKK